LLSGIDRQSFFVIRRASQSDASQHYRRKNESKRLVHVHDSFLFKKTIPRELAGEYIRILKNEKRPDFKNSVFSVYSVVKICVHSRQLPFPSVIASHPRSPAQLCFGSRFPMFGKLEEGDDAG